MKESPWDEVKGGYLSGKKIADIARRCEIPYNTFRKRISRESWAAERKILSRKCTRKTIDSIIDGKASYAINVMKRDIDRYARIEDALIGQVFSLNTNGQPSEIKKTLNKAETFADAVRLVKSVIGHIENPERASALLVDLAYKREALEYTKMRMLSEMQFNELLEGILELAIKILNNDSDKLEQFANRFEKLLERVVLWRA